ncbi:MAG: metalloregulator ArsR/SmtB family transcription factor [Chloroflexi bacterium]|nr:metalloregulator ArsR/SmtB family transcription factor [Chloroflexota bacterium]
MDTYTRQSTLLKALAHPVRLQIAELLSQREACVCHMEAMLHLRQAYISQQLMVLRKAGLLRERRDGTYIFYRLADAKVVQLLTEVRRSVGARAPVAIAPFLEECSCPRCEAVAEKAR